MSVTLKTRFKSFLPPKNLLPLLFAYMFDSISISSYWIFFGIWLNEELITPEAGFKYPYLMLTVVLAIPGFVSIIGGSILSNFSDKIGRRKEIMFFARLLLMIQCILLIFFNNTVLQVLLILATLSFHNVFYILHNALSTSICDPDKRGEVSSFQMFFASLGWMIGSGFTGLVYDNLGMIGGLGLGAGFALITGVLTLFSPTEPIIEEKEEVPVIEPIPIKMPVTKIRFRRNSSSSYWQIIIRRSVIILLIILAVADFSFGSFNTLSSVYLKKVGLPSNFIALTNTIATLLGMIFQLFVGKILDKKGRKPVLLVAIVMYPILGLLMFLLSGYWVAIFILYSYPLYALKVPTANAIMSDVTSTKERARGMSLLQFENNIFLYLGAFLGAFISDVSSKGLLNLPLLPLAFGALAFVLAVLIFKETNKKVLQRKGIQHKILSKEKQ